MQQPVLKAFAPAKINLALHVVGQRADGYHLLDSLVAFATIGDEVDVSAVPGSTPKEFYFALEGAFSEDLEFDNTNSIVKASSFFKEACADIETGLGVCLTKNLPISSGIGGGSADAAATLLALARATGHTNGDKLVEMGKQLGADVPLCIHSTTLRASGIGHDIALVEGFPSLHLLLVNPRVGISTPTVFKKLKVKDQLPLTALPNELTFENILIWLNEQRNDLQETAIALDPIVGEVISAIEGTGALLSRMSGSGATCFGIYNSFDECENARLQMFVKHPDWWTVVTRTKDFGPNRVEETISSDSWALQN